MAIIGHLDMDAFFASVEERDGRGLAGLPIVVGADPMRGEGRGVVSTANYRARRYGIHSAMPIAKAWQLAETARASGEPETVFLRPDFDRYRETSGRIMTILREYSPLVEEASVDEAYFAVSCDTWEAAEQTGRNIKERIRGQERLACSIGIAPNKMVAKIACNIRKPDGLTVVRPDAVETFLEDLSVRALPGVGPKAGERLKQEGISTVRDLKRYTTAELTERFGKSGAELYEKARGRRDEPLVEAYEAKSIGEQETFPRDTSDTEHLMERIECLCRGVADRFRESGFRTYRTVTVTVRYADFETKNRSRTLPAPAHSYETLLFESLRLLTPFFDRRENPNRKQFRLLGVRVEKLE